MMLPGGRTVKLVSVVTTGAVATLVTEALRIVPGARLVVVLVTVTTLVRVPATVGVTVMKSTTAELDLKLAALVVTVPLEKTGWLKVPPARFFQWYGDH